MIKDLTEEIYNLQLSDLLKEVKEFNYHKFSKKFWTKPESKNCSIKLIKYIYEDMLNFSDEDIINNTNFSFFRNYGLDGMIKYVYDNSLYNAINTVYPNRFKIWEISVVPKNYWTIETGIEATKWLIEDKCNWFDPKKQIKPTANVFIKYKLNGMLQLLFNRSPYKAVNAAYPGLFKPWEIGIVPQKYWSLENGVQATKWLLEGELDLFNNKDIKISKAVFQEYGLVGMLDIIFNGSCYQAINTVYPNLFKPWEVCAAPKKYWTIENSIDATKWLIEKKLRWFDDKVIIDNISRRIFTEYGLGGMISTVYKSSPYLALNSAYPGRFSKNDFKTKM